MFHYICVFIAFNFLLMKWSNNEIVDKIFRAWNAGKGPDKRFKQDMKSFLVKCTEWVKNNDVHNIKVYAEDCIGEDDEEYGAKEEISPLFEDKFVSEIFIEKRLEDHTKDTFFTEGGVDIAWTKDYFILGGGGPGNYIYVEKA